MNPSSTKPVLDPIKRYFLWQPDQIVSDEIHDISPDLRSKFTEEDVHYIREAYNDKRGTITTLARRFNCSLSTITGVVTGRTWDWLPYHASQQFTKESIDALLNQYRERDKLSKSTYSISG